MILIISCIVICIFIILITIINLIRKISTEKFIIAGLYCRQPKKMTVKTNPRNNKKRR